MVDQFFFISRYFTFDETHIRLKCKDSKVNELETMIEKSQFQVEVSTTETREEEVVETPISITIERQYLVSPNYHQAREGVRRENVPSQRHIYTNLICYALSVVEGLQDKEPKTFRKLVQRKNIQRWLMAVNDEIKPLMKIVLGSL